MSMLMTLSKPGECSKLLCTASSQRPRCQQTCILVLEKLHGLKVLGGSMNVFIKNKSALSRYAFEFLQK